MSVGSVPVLVLAGIALYAGTCHLLLYLRRRPFRENLTFGCFCLCVCFHDIFCAGLYSAASPEEGVRWQRLQSVTVVLGGIALLWFIADYTRRRCRLFVAVLTVVCLGVLLLGLTAGGGLLWTDQPDVKHVDLPFGMHVSYQEMAAGPLTYLLSLLGLMIFAYAIWAGTAQYRQGERRAAAPLLLATAIFGLGVMNDSLVATGAYSFVYLIEYAFLAFVVLMTLSMTNQLHRITEVEAALRMSEERLKLAMEGARGGMWEHYPLTDETYLSPRWFTMLGYAPGRFPQALQTWIDLLHPEDKRRALRKIGELLRSQEEHFSVEYRLKSKSGDWIWMHALGEVVKRDEEGRVERIVATHFDVSARKSAEAALRESEGRLRNLIRSCPMGVHMYQLEEDDRLVLIDSNPAADELTGIETRKLIGKTIEEAFPPLAETEVPDMYRRAARDGLPWEARDLHYEDPEIRGAYDLFAFQTSPGRMAVMFLEVTERIRTEEQLRQSQKMQAVGRLAGGIAHDFNNLLQAIRGYNELTLGRVGPGHAIRGNLQQVAKASERAAALVRQLLTFSRRERLEPKPTDLGDLITEILKMLRRIIGAHVELEVSCRPDLGRIFADRGQIEQVVMNLCLNARDAMPDGGTLTIETDRTSFDRKFCEANPWARPGDFVVLRVADTGEGIPFEIQSRIFEPFYTTKEVGEGAGLGLATVYAIVERHEGLIVMSSQPGKGTEFRVYLPVWSGSAEGEKPEDEEEESKVRGGSETILVAEDKVAVRKLVVRVLEGVGYRLVVARDGEEAVRLLAKHADAIDLALLDISMPKKSGREVHAELVALRPGIPVIFCTGYAGEGVDFEGLPDGSYGLIRKPYSRNVLLREVRKALDAREPAE